MKKLILSTLLLFGVEINYLAQNDTIYINGVPKITKKHNNGLIEAQSPVKSDDYLYEFSYGIPFTPSREASVMGSSAFGNVSNIVDTKNLNHLCGDVDYQLNDEFSVGLELTYAQSEFTYNRRFYVQGTTGGTVGSVIRDSLYKMRATKIRFLAKMSYHFNISEKFDAFLIGGFGYKQFKYSTKDSYINSLNLMNEILPLAIRVGIGGRFFINKNVAIHAEGGVGGPLMQIGLSYKMH